MASGSRQWDVPEESLRIAHPQKIYLKFSSSEASVEEYLVDLSMTGMFVRCSDPPLPGTLFEFKMQLASGVSSTRGEAVVVWVREQQQRLSHPRGMGVRFTKLDPESRDQIRATVERYSRASGDPRELQNLRSVVEETLGDVLDSERTPEPLPAKPAPRPRQQAPAPVKSTSAVSIPVSPVASSLRKYARTQQVARRERARVPWGWIGSLLVLLAAVATGWAWTLARSDMPLPEADASATQQGQQVPSPPSAAAEGAPAGAEPSQIPSSDTVLSDTVLSDTELSDTELSDTELSDTEPLINVPSDTVSSGAAAPSEAPPEEPPPSPEALVLENLNSWAAGWANQDAETYLSFYSSFFRPARGQARIAWRRDRRERIERPQRIELEIRNIRTEALSDTRFRVVFEQTYRSETFEDTMTKALEWVLEDGNWKILKEEAVG